MWRRSPLPGSRRLRRGGWRPPATRGRGEGNARGRGARRVPAARPCPPVRRSSTLCHEGAGAPDHDRRDVRGPATQGPHPRDAPGDDHEYPRRQPSVRTYYDTAYLAVLPDTEHFTASSPGVKAAVRVRSATRSYTLLTIDLGRKLFSGKHTPLTLGFDVPDRGGDGAPGRPGGREPRRVPGLGLRDRRHARQHRDRRLPAALQRAAPGGLDAARPRAPTTGPSAIASGTLEGAAHASTRTSSPTVPGRSMRRRWSPTSATGTSPCGPRVVGRPDVGQARRLAREARVARIEHGRRTAVRG